MISFGSPQFSRAPWGENPTTHVFSANRPDMPRSICREAGAKSQKGRDIKCRDPVRIVETPAARPALRNRWRVDQRPL